MNVVEPARLELLELDIDVRIADLWRATVGVTEWNLENVGAFMRAAYGRGYVDALEEPRRGLLCHDHGYRPPDRQAAA